MSESTRFHPIGHALRQPDVVKAFRELLQRDPIIIREWNDPDLLNGAISR